MLAFLEEAVTVAEPVPGFQAAGGRVVVKTGVQGDGLSTAASSYLLSIIPLT